MAGRLDAVTLRKIFPLEGHAVLHGNAAAQRFDTVDISLRDRLRVVEEPVQPVERNVTVDLLEYIQHPANRFVIGRMQAERPAMFHQMTHHALQLILHAGGQVGSRLQKVFKVGG